MRWVVLVGALAACSSSSDGTVVEADGGAGVGGASGGAADAAAGAGGTAGGAGAGGGAGASGAAAGGAGGAGGGACVPGAQVACACPGGVQGVQVCLSDGKGYGPCECPDAGAGGSAGGGQGGVGGSAGASTGGAGGAIIDCPKYTGWANCDGVVVGDPNNPLPGQTCETSIQTSPNCGVCGNACAGGCSCVPLPSSCHQTAAPDTKWACTCGGTWQAGVVCN